MISLAAPAVIEDACTAPSVADFEEARRDLVDRGVPIDFLEAAICPPSQRSGQAVTTVLVKIDALRFLARIPLRGDMIAIAAYPRDAIGRLYGQAPRHGGVVSV